MSLTLISASSSAARAIESAKSGKPDCSGLPRELARKPRATTGGPDDQLPFGSMRPMPYGARSARDNIAFACASLTKLSDRTSQVRGRASFIAIQLTMHALLLRCAIGAGASGC